MRKRFICRRVLHSVLALASAAFFVHSASGEESPYATGGEVTVRDLGNFRVRYIHVFTNTAEATTFASTGKRDLKLRYLVVGGGGAGGSRYSGSTMGGGGGGGGGVCEKEDVVFESGATWQVLVGKGASSYSKTAGASSISNGVADVETVPGGGNGADAGTTDCVATAGASGGGASRRTGQYTGGLGTYTNSIFGVEYGPFKGGDTAANRAGAGGGGASENGSKNTVGGVWGKGGEGLASDITGESLVYGSGGGGGCGKNASDNNKHYQGGRGGSRAGDGGLYDASSNAVAATSAEANSGGGGGGAAGWDKTSVGKGADGIVVIRYEVAESPCAGGDVITRTLKRGTTYTYLHKFTNVTEAAEFVNESGRDLKLRYLVVGAGGSGIGGWASNNGGGGGGGGGVCEKKDIAFANGVVWSVKVGKGSTSKTSVAGASVISNGTEEIELVPGGGNGGARASGGGTLATSGAAGGGGAMGDYKVAGKGTYQSSILGVTPEGTEPGKGFSGGTGSRCGAGGGGAGGAGQSGSSALDVGKGGKGLASEITGESLYYGAGGGGGLSFFDTYSGGGLGGSNSRGGDGVRVEFVDNVDGTITTNILKATAGAVNSGSGGGGGSNVSGYTAGARGADGVVIFRYDFNATPPGLIFMVR